MFPAYVNSLPQGKREQVFESFRSLIEDCHEEAVRYLDRESWWDMMFHFGDLTGGWNEKGIHHASVIPLAERALGQYRSMSRFFGMCWGNHDTGYGRTIGGASLESVMQCKRLSPLFWSHDSGGLVFVGICSPLLQTFDEYDDEELADMRKEQLDFVADTLRKCRNRPWVLCTHDPGVGALAPVAGAYTETPVAMLYGDKHGVWSGIAMRLLGSVKRRGFEGYCLRRSVLCPSTAPLWWPGCSLLTGEMEMGKLDFEVKQYASPELRARIRAMPFTSFHRALYWMLSFQVKHALGR